MDNISKLFKKEQKGFGGKTYIPKLPDMQSGETDDTSVSPDKNDGSVFLSAYTAAREDNASG